MKVIEEITDEEAAAAGENYRKWKKKQPEYIAVEMTNKEIVAELINAVNFYHLVRTNNYKKDGKVYVVEIRGKLYKKVKNPYNQFQTIIPWPVK